MQRNTLRLGSDIAMRVAYLYMQQSMSTSPSVLCFLFRSTTVVLLCISTRLSGMLHHPGTSQIKGTGPTHVQLRHNTTLLNYLLLPSGKRGK